MKKRLLIKVILIGICFILIYGNKTFAATVKMQGVKDGTVWNYITVSDSYKACEELDSVDSTLGTDKLQPHLTTDADWSAMAIMSASQYGGAKSNAPDWTNGNASGVYKIGQYTSQSTGILNTADKNTTPYVSGLFNEDGSVKKYVKQWSPTREENNFVSFLNPRDGGTFGAFSALAYWGSLTSHPVSTKQGLFGVYGGYYISASSNNAPAGGAYSHVSFRPVIWN